MISLKRYLETDVAAQAALTTAVLDAYRSTLTAVGICATQAYPSAGQGLQRALTGLGQRLAEDVEPELVARTEGRIMQELQRWGERAEANLQQKTSDVKELLVVLARTASSLASNGDRNAQQFDEFTAKLERIADLEDLTQMRASLVRGASELRSKVEHMSRSARESVAQLQAEVVTYQARLEEVSEAASRDPLTGLFNRGRMDQYLGDRISSGQTFSVAMMDLNGFKQVNDRLGHAAGDDLLKQFAAELRGNARAGDTVGRWGGDEFLVILDCPAKDAQAHIGRVEKWVVGDYVIATPGGRSAREKVHLGAAIGLAEWMPGQSARDLIAKADAAMYANKAARR